MWSTDGQVPDPAAEILPVIKGWRLLVRPAFTPDKTEGGIVLPDSYRDREDHGQIMGRVLAMGDLCYTREDMLQAGPWCEIGDYILFGKYEGKRVEVADVKLLILNDDNVLAVVPDPSKIFTM